MFDAIPMDLKSAREEARLSVPYVSKALGVSDAQIYFIEKGERNPSWTTLLKMCVLYRIELKINAQSAKFWGLELEDLFPNKDT